MKMNKIKGIDVYNIIKLCPSGQIWYFFTCDSRSLINPESNTVGSTFLYEWFMEVPKIFMEENLFELNSFIDRITNDKFLYKPWKQ